MKSICVVEAYTTKISCFTQNLEQINAVKQ